mmetsp:Transcript_27313/g.49259  ORF Transcript_27313/g.49259 Transcript_27313/m.49259 type:complete len:224 (+) Transcript_27313:93-764(+)|eukprot:CAMPEP_0201887222 /NCGR_PEP_ID=MMETSP0902-20130614/24408_1 /ASSEMBLY_ACC=CAM_ASM_000551 /TAXON_ID=420261 /ORGANISM="Thalassiosira antarctica, Strain CCMP982" /LENGTH=223 /DNA_ID=CAMNT_0048417095 /DNA_START=59 /DNA_END=730 /DNA_ORIENTATION=-
MCIITAKRHISSLSIMSSNNPSSPPQEGSAAAATTTGATALKRVGTKRRRLDCCNSDTNPSSSSSSSTMMLTPSRSQAPHTASQNKRRQRTVHFAASTETRIVPKWTKAERASSWYSALDVALFKLQEGSDAAILRCLISNALCVEHLPQEASLYRGLERLLSPQIIVEIKERRKVTIKSVLVEQAMQRRRGLKVVDEMKLAEVSRFYSEKASVWASNLGSLV